jgi:hypothetical protein
MVTVIPHGGPTVSSTVVTADGWYPDVTLSALRERVGLDRTWTDERLAPLVRDAIDAVAGILTAWRAAREAEGAASLDQVAPADRIDGVSVAVQRWRSAIDCRVRAALLTTTRDFDSTGAGHDRADALEATADDWLARSHEALSRLMGRPRATVELI